MILSWKFVPNYDQVIAANEGTERLQNESIKKGSPQFNIRRAEPRKKEAKLALAQCPKNNNS
jgi:hypothetical protein